jgi:glycosyltransferase involved in cell wall biosynthesis
MSTPHFARLEPKVAQNISSVSVVIPCFNEEEAIPRVLPKLLFHLKELHQLQRISAFEVIVVDDHSTDASRSRLSEYSEITVVSNPDERGYGAALKTGFRVAAGDLVAFLDMDDTYAPADLGALLSPFSDSSVEMVNGSRMSARNQMELLRFVGNDFYARLVRLLFRVPNKDVCTGFRVFRRSLIDEVCRLPQKDLDFSLSMTLWGLTNGRSAIEVPISYGARLGRSKLAVTTDGFRFLGTILSSYVRTKILRGHRSEPKVSRSST